MSLLLNIPYAEKDEAKSLGARWNPNVKKWYVENKKDYPKFSKWILNGQSEANIICDYFYIVVGKRTCFRCKKTCSVIGFGIENMFTLYDLNKYDRGSNFEYIEGQVHIASEISPLPDKFLQFLNQKFNYHLGHSKTTDTDYYANHCSHCGVIQGAFYLFEEVDSPFFLDVKEKADELTLYKINLSNDFVAKDISIGYGSNDWMIKEFSKIITISGDFNL